MRKKIELDFMNMMSGGGRSTLLNQLVFSLNHNGTDFYNDVTGTVLNNVNGVLLATPVVAGSAPAAACVAASSQYLNTPDTADLSVGDIDFTVAAWINLTTATSTAQTICAHYLSAGNQRSWAIQLDTSVRIVFAITPFGSTPTVQVLASTFGVVSASTPYLVLAWHDAVANTINISINNGTSDNTAHTTGVHNSTGDVTLGAIANPLTYLNGKASFMLWKRLLTTAEKATLYNGGSGNKYPFSSTAVINGQIVFDGNSMTSSTYSSYPATAVSQLSGNWQSSNFGVSGQTTIEMIADAATQIDTLYDLLIYKNIVVCWEGTNDLRLGATRADAQARLVQYCQDRQSAGWQVVILTILPRTQVGLPASFEADRIAINSYILANYASFADAVADVAADGRIGDFGDSNDTTYYTDGIHMTTAGYNIVAGIVATAISAL